MTDLVLVSSNPNKAAEAARILGSTVRNVKHDISEIQSYSLEEVVRAKAEAAYNHFRFPLLVDDVALDVAALGWFPGPFIKFWEENVKYERMVEIARALKDMRARVRCGVGYFDGKDFIYAEGSVAGTITERRGDGAGAWGFDYYFVPDGYETTYAEMGYRKDEVSHRTRGLELMKQKLQAAGVL